MRTMKKIGFLVSLACLAALAGEASAAGGGAKGQGQRLRDGSCATATGSKTQTMQRQRLQDGSGAATGTQRQGKMQRLGAGDGTGAAVQPQDGTGYGAPAVTN